MFCPECGASHPDGTMFCSECGASIGAPQPAAQQPAPQSAPQYAAPQYAAPQYAAPVYQAQPGYPNYHGAPVNPLSKKEYVKQQATPGVKTASKLVLILLAACVLIMVIGHITMMNTSIEDIPVVSMAFEVSGVDADEFDDAKDELEYELELLEEEFEDYEDDLEEELSKKEMKWIEDMFDVMKDCTKTLSINNVKKLADLMADLSDTDAAEYLDLDDGMDEIEQISAVIGGVSTTLLISAIFSLLFTIIGALTKVNVLVVLGAIGATSFCAVLYGFLFVALILVAHIGMIVMLSKVNKEYKDYRNGTLPLTA